MNLAVNTRFLLPGKMEGLGYFTHEVARRLVERHPDWTFYFLFDRAYDPAYLYGPNVQPVVLFPPARHPVLWYWWFEWSVARWLNSRAVDLFFSPDNYLSLRARMPTVLVMHDLAYAHYPEQIPPLVRRYYRYFVPRFLRRANRVVTVSDFVRGDITAHFPDIPEADIDVAGNGVKAHFQPLSEVEKEIVRDRYSEGQPYFFYVGAVHPRKNLERLIRAFDLFKEKSGLPHRLLIGGRFAWQAETVRQAYEQSPFRQHISLLGYLDELELARVLAAGRALAYVSLFEGFGVPLLEAMHCEVPVLTSNVSSLPEVAGHAALQVDPFSISEIAAGLQRLAVDDRLCRELIEKGKLQRRKYSWEQTTDVIEDSLLRCRLQENDK